MDRTGITHLARAAHPARGLLLVLLALALVACGGPHAPVQSTAPTGRGDRPAPPTKVGQAPEALPTLPSGSRSSDSASAPPTRVRESEAEAPVVVEREVTTVVEGEAAFEAPAEAPAPDPFVGAAEEPASDGTTGTGGGSAASGAAPLATVVSVGEAPPAHPHPSTQQYEPVTAGMVDDNEQWRAYLDYRARHSHLWVNDRDVSERYILQVWDDRGQPVHDAQVQIYAEQGLYFEGRTDAGGRLLFHPLAVEQGYNQWNGQQTYPTFPSEFEVVARKGRAQQRANFQRYGQEHWSISLPGAPVAAYTQLDLLFLIDATGSMADEIDKLKATMDRIAAEIAALPARPDVRYGLVAYRDRGDEFVVRAYDFTPDLGAFQHTLALLEADAGGDTPEALNEALHRSLLDLHWRADDAVRLVLLVADAPPHLDYGEPFSYDEDMIEAVRRGVKILPVGASGLDEQGEYIFRQLAQFTGGKFVFLTYAQAGNPASGPGTETEHHVANYSVDTLDRLVVRLVQDELAKLPRVQ